MRSLLRDVAENPPLGNTTTLADPTVVSDISHTRHSGPVGQVDRGSGENTLAHSSAVLQVGASLLPG